MTLVAVLSTLLLAALVLAIGANLKTTERRLLYRPRRLYTSGDADFRRALGILLGPPLVAGNRITTLVNGAQIYPAMLNAIRTAQTNITFETFVFRDGVGATFVEELSAAARRGVQVHMLLDWLGSRTMNQHLLQAARAAGCDLHVYHPPSWYHLGRLNNRTHRKLLIVDGKLGFTGGVGMGIEWKDGLQGLPPWRDSHFKAEGPVVAQMQAVFVDNWIKATGRVLHGAEYFPRLMPAGDMDAQMFGSSPVGGSESMHLMVLLALTAAKTSIDIENAYFDIFLSRYSPRGRCQPTKRKGGAWAGNTFPFPTLPSPTRPHPSRRSNACASRPVAAMPSSVPATTASEIGAQSRASSGR